MQRMTWLLAGVTLAAGVSVPAQEPAAPTIDPQEAIDACRVLEDRLRRLDCYDRIPGASVTGDEDGLAESEADTAAGSEVAAETTEPAAPVASSSQPGAVATAPPAAVDSPLERSRMMRRFELDDATHGGLFRVRRHNPVYVLPARWSSNPNEQPSTPTRGAPALPESLDSIEAKFQLSLKSKVLDNLFGDNGDFWVGYTQQSNWQSYNSTNSSPFRETNYAPEAWLSWRTGVNLLGWRWQMINVGFVHQSNGRAEPLSRSWNRVYAQFGFENGDWELYLKPWLRVDTGSGDDNPGIDEFLGHGEARLVLRRGRHDFSLTGRAAPGENRGALQFDWHYPLKGDVKAYLQIFHGYGETLIDFNHRQTTIGLGVSLVQ